MCHAGDPHGRSLQLCARLDRGVLALGLLGVRLARALGRRERRVGGHHQLARLDPPLHPAPQHLEHGRRRAAAPAVAVAIATVTGAGRAPRRRIVGLRPHERRAARGIGLRTRRLVAHQPSSSSRSASGCVAAAAAAAACPRAVRRRQEGTAGAREHHRSSAVDGIGGARPRRVADDALGRTGSLLEESRHHLAMTMMTP